MKMDFQTDAPAFVVPNLKNTRYATGQYKALGGVKAEKEPKTIKNPKRAEFIPQKKKSRCIFQSLNGLTKM